MADNLLTKQPPNVNLINTNKYSLVFPTLPHISWFIYSLNLPGVSTTSPTVETAFVATKRSGDKLIYEPLTITCLADEDLRGWQEAYDWLVGATFPRFFSQYIGQKNLNTNLFPSQKLYSDGILTIRTNANNPNLQL